MFIFSSLHVFNTFNEEWSPSWSSELLLYYHSNVFGLCRWKWQSFSEVLQYGLCALRVSGTIGHLCPTQEGGDTIARETKASHLIGWIGVLNRLLWTDSVCRIFFSIKCGMQSFLRCLCVYVPFLFIHRQI